MIISEPISIALSVAAVSVVKNGLPVPAAKITTLPFSKWRCARPTINVSQIASILIALCTLTSSPLRSKASRIAIELMTVASMPM